MAQPFFPGIEEVMTILMGEIPSGPYATDRADDPNPDNRSYSSSEIRAHAQVFANLYANLQEIEQNKFLTTVQLSGIGYWEKDLFSQAVDASLPFETRKANAIAKYRAQGGLSYPYIKGIVSGILTPQGLAFDIVTYNCQNAAGGDGAWILDLTELEVGTYLASADPLLGTDQSQPYILGCDAILNLHGTVTSGSPTITAITDTSAIEVGAQIVAVGFVAGTTVLSVSAHSITVSANSSATHTLEDLQIQNYWAAGLDTEEFESIQETAYTFELRIYGTADAVTLSELDNLLSQNEKATVTHIIQNNFPLPPDGTLVDMGPFTADTLIDNIDFGRFTWLAATYDVWDFGAF